jgi:hypothetical protein
MVFGLRFMVDAGRTRPWFVIMNRRTFLAGTIKASLGIGFGSHLVDRGPALSDVSTQGTPAAGDQGVVAVEPLAPADHQRFISRPDLTPAGVSITKAAAFAVSGLGSSYIFCAPKSPLAANAGRIPSLQDSFPAGATPGLMILDTNGELVWFKPLPGGHVIPFNFRVQTYQDKPTLTWFEGARQQSHGVGNYFLADDTYETIARVESTGYPADLHEFLLTPDGTALHTAYEEGVVTDEGRPLVVGHAQEVDVATNELLFDWPCFPAVSPELSYSDPFGDYFHINSIGLWPDTSRNLLISSRNTSAVYLVDRQTKGVIWRLGGKRSDFAMGPGARFYFQHDARALADGTGLSIFDDASQPCPEDVASGKVLILDQATKSATLQRRYLHTDHEFNTPSQGNCQLLPNGGHVVGWGFVPFFSAYSADDSAEPGLILDGRFPEGAASYRTFLFDWTGHPPRGQLALVVHRAGGTGAFTAWVSWNGATEVSKWRIDGGPSTSSLDALSTANKQGFETTIDITHVGAKYFEAVALDALGRIIGRSDTVLAT